MNNVRRREQRAPSRTAGREPGQRASSRCAATQSASRPRRCPWYAKPSVSTDHQRRGTGSRPGADPAASRPPPGDSGVGSPARCISSRGHGLEDRLRPRVQQAAPTRAARESVPRARERRALQLAERRRPGRSASPPTTTASRSGRSRKQSMQVRSDAVTGHRGDVGRVRSRRWTSMPGSRVLRRSRGTVTWCRGPDPQQLETVELRRRRARRRRRSRFAARTAASGVRQARRRPAGPQPPHLPRPPARRSPRPHAGAAQRAPRRDPVPRRSRAVTRSMRPRAPSRAGHRRSAAAICGRPGTATVDTAPQLRRARQQPSRAARPLAPAARRPRAPELRWVSAR